MSEAREIDIKLGPSEINLNAEKGIKVVESVPTKTDSMGITNPAGTEVIVVSNAPHIFTVDKLTAIDSAHPSGVTLENVKVMMAHGNRADNEWKFLNGNSVAETVDAYNEYAGKNGVSPVEFLVVCNQNPSSVSENLEVGELSYNPNIHIAHATGSKVHIDYAGKSRLDKDGKVYLQVSTDDKFFDLDKLVQQKKDQSLIKI